MKDENDANFLEIINAIIPSLNGEDPNKLVDAYITGIEKQPAKSKHLGPTVMTEYRYLILLYVAGRVKSFINKFGTRLDNKIYFSARRLEKVANSFRKPFIFDRPRAFKYHYSRYGSYVITKREDLPINKDTSKTRLTDLVALTKKGKDYCESTIDTLLACIPEQKRPKQKLKNVVGATHEENFEKECQNYGLNWLRSDYFESRESNETDFDDWKKGFPVDLPFIKAKRELRREALIADIKSNLENQGKLLIVGQPGSSKTTILMELMCDYLDDGYEVLYNYGLTDIRNVDSFVNFIEDTLSKDKKILVAIDNAHKEKTYSIFYFIDKLSNSLLTKKLKIILTVRKPEFDWLLNGLEQVEEEIRKPIRKLYADPNFSYQLPYFTWEETKEFVERYSMPELLDKITAEIYDSTKGDPVMIMYSVFGKGLDHNVAEMSDRYLRTQLERKTMLTCAILDISNTKITDKILKKCGVLETAHDLDGSILRRNSGGSWNTKHPRWDLELFSFLFNKKRGTLLEQRKQDLKDSIVALYHLREETIIYSVIETLYHIAVEKFVPRDVIESVFQQTKSEITKGTPPSGYLVVLSMHVDKARNIAEAYYLLKKEREGTEMLDRLAFSGWMEKGMNYQERGQCKEAIECYNVALEINPNDDDVLFLKTLALAEIGDSISNGNSNPI